MHDWINGSQGRWVSMGVTSHGEYGIPEGLVCGVATTCEGGRITRVQGLEVDGYAQTMLDKSLTELTEERDAVIELLG